ncbi:MAG: VOC family protein [Candidatus Pacebacteria bacterium]|nr:VOC family protein [Candidatus Paceibacterota bacterium]
MKNIVAHFEIPAEDLVEAQDFYSAVFGWNFKPWDENYVSVIAAKSNEKGMSLQQGAINGGIQKRGPRTEGPTVVVSVEDIDDIIDKIMVAGGSIVLPKESMDGMGFYAQFKDVDGNRLGLFQPAKK